MDLLSDDPMMAQPVGQTEQQPIAPAHPTPVNLHETLQRLAQAVGQVTVLHGENDTRVTNTIQQLSQQQQLLTQQQQLLAQTMAQLAEKQSESHKEPDLSNVTRHVKPPDFYGDKDDTWDLDTWEFQVREFMSLLTLHTKLTPDAQIRVAGGFLRGNAATWFRDLRQKPTTEQPTDLDTFFANLKAVFQPIGTAKQARERLHTARMRDREAVAAYTTYMKRLFMAIPDMSEGDKLDKYVHGLTTRLRTEVMLRDPKTVEEAAKYAATFEAALRLAHGPQYRTNNYGYDRGTIIHTRSTASEPTPMEVDAVEKGNNKQQITNRPFPNRSTDSNVICYYCKKPGHISRDCRKRRFEEHQSVKTGNNSKNDRRRAQQQRSRK